MLARTHLHPIKLYVRKELLRRLAHRGDVGEVELQEDGLLSRLSLELRDRRVRFGCAACGEVNLCVMVQERLDRFFSDTGIPAYDNTLYLAYADIPLTSESHWGSRMLTHQ